MAEIPIIDSHIHLWREADLAAHAWYKPDHPLASENSLPQYKAATTSSSSRLRGYVLIEADQKSGLDEDGWEGPLKEISWMRRVVAGEAGGDEDSAAADGEKCLGLIPWAPVPAGPDALAKYLEKAEEAAGPEAWAKVKGFRYLLQDKPAGTMLKEEFIEGVKYLGKRGFVFEVGVDQHRRGKKQLEETVEMISRAHDDVPDEEKTTFILNHMCKPDLTVYNLTDPAYTNWRTAIYTLSSCQKTYMKLSGGLPEMTTALRNRSADDIFEAVLPWLGILLATFGPEKLMFASDWPVCTVGVEANAWEKWLGVVERMGYMASLSEEKMRLLYRDTAVKAFGLDV